MQNIVDSLQGKIKKSVVQKSLDSLLDSKQISAKEFGKSKVYYADQSNFEVPPKEEVEKTNKQIADEQSLLYDLESQKKALEQGIS